MTIREETPPERMEQVCTRPGHSTECEIARLTDALAQVKRERDEDLCAYAKNVNKFIDRTYQLGDELARDKLTLAQALAFVASDAIAASFQSLGQYRSALLAALSTQTGGRHDEA